MRKDERGTIIGTSLRLSLGFSGFGFLWAKQSRNLPLWQRQCKSNIDSARLLRFLIGVIGCQS